MTDEQNDKHDNLVFQGSPEPTIGVELELQILDRDTGDLAAGAVRILQMCAQEKVPGVAAELMQSMLEVKTGVCANVAEARAQMLPVLRTVRNIAASLGFDLALGGTHPFHCSSASAVFPAERYERIVERLAWLTYQRVVFGLHVHVGIPDGDLALGVTSHLVKYLPHLLALSANSPFWQGIDTGLASSRVALYGLLPHSGIPPHFGSWKDFRSYCQVMTDCKVLGSYKDIYWDIRPRPDFGTIEFRICDVPPSLELTFAIVALTRCLVINALNLVQSHPRLRRGDQRRHWIAVENKWLATRYGLPAPHIKSPAGKRRPLKADLADILEKLTLIARANGEENFLAPLHKLEQFESGSERQRRLYRDTGDWKSVMAAQVDSLASELQSGA